jgi:methionyl-tRNA formyltransferase
MGTPEFAVPALKALYQAGHTIVAVYCQPPREKGRGYQLQKNAVHKIAEQLGIPVHTPTSLKPIEVQQEFAAYKPDVAVVAAYGLLLPQAILDIPLYGCINIHASLLPRWRGAAPIQRAIQAGDQLTGITIMQMDAGLDTGPMLTTAIVEITPLTTAADLQNSLATVGASLIVKTLEQLQKGACVPIVQPTKGVTYAAKLTKNEGELDFSKTAYELDCQIRAFNPWPGTWFTYEGEIIKVLKAKPLKDFKGSSGQFYSLREEPLAVACAEGGLSLQELQRPGARPLKVEEFLRGYTGFKIRKV